MTKYTRRSFVKRTGSATLGAALGLGLLPSLTRKLHAADTSTGEGVKTTNTLGVGVTSKIDVPGGRLCLSVKFTINPGTPNTCVLAIEGKKHFTMHFEFLNGQSNFVGEFFQTVVYTCRNGGVVVTPTPNNNIGGPYNYPPNSGEKALVTVDVHNDSGNQPPPPNPIWVTVVVAGTNQAEGGVPRHFPTDAVPPVTCCQMVTV